MGERYSRRLIAIPGAASIVAIACALGACNPGVDPTVGGPAGAAGADNARGRTYHTGFLLTEDPISEGGRWINGRADGSTAVLRGKWGRNQTVRAKLGVPHPYRDPYAQVVRWNVPSRASPNSTAWESAAEVKRRASCR